MDGKTHARNARRVLLLSVPVCATIAATYDPYALAGIAGSAIGWLVDSDLGDMHNVTTRAEKRWWNISPILGWAWEVYWYPLARAIPHRSPLSHLPPLCTLIRLAYMLLTAWIALRVWGVSFDTLGWVETNWHSARWLYWGFAWWIMQDVVHLAADGWRVTKRKRR